MKQQTKAAVLVLAFFLLCAVLLIWLHQLTGAESETVYLEWEAAYVVSDGEETEFDPNSEQPEIDRGERYTLTTTLPEREEAQWLIFEAAGMDVELYIDGQRAWHSTAGQREETANLAQVQLPLSTGGGETLTMIIKRVEGEAWIFPPLLRLTSDPAATAETLAYANYYAIPIGAAALIIALLWGLFLLGILQNQPDWRLLLLLAAAVLLTLNRAASGYGDYFMTREAADILGNQWVGNAAAIVLVVYLAAHKAKAFWRRLGKITAWSAGIFAVGVLISYLQGSYLSRYLAESVAALFDSGYYSWLLYWLTLWLIIVCAALSVAQLMQSIADAQALSQSLTVKNQLVMDSYRQIERGLRDTAELRHEFSHQLAAMEAMFQSGDMERLGKALAQWRKADADARQIRFSEQPTVDAILRDASGRAKAANIEFQATALLPKVLSVPEEDLCALLMNMLDNALEGAERTAEGEQRYIRVNLRIRNGYLAILCENSYDGVLAFDEEQHMISTKPSPQSHGFGMAQMRTVAERYGSVLDVKYTDKVFTVQTALFLNQT